VYVRRVATLRFTGAQVTRSGISLQRYARRSIGSDIRHPKMSLLGAVPVHLAGGMIGTICLGLFATGTYGLPTPTGADTSTVVSGLFYGGGIDQLWIQMYGTFSVAIATFVLSMALMYAVKATGTLRVSHEGELEGLDRHEHGVPAYPEFITSFGSDVILVDLNGLSPAAPMPTAPNLATWRNQPNGRHAMQQERAPIRWSPLLASSQSAS
jgi:hypothetical protein